MLYPKKAIETIQKWSDSHPQKTYLSELLKIFPDIPLNDDGTPNSLCPSDLGLNEKENAESMAAVLNVGTNFLFREKIKTRFEIIKNIIKIRWVIAHLIFLSKIASKLLVKNLDGNRLKPFNWDRV